MIVFDLICGNRHVFEAWFGSGSAYEAQRKDGLIACPMCGDTVIEKAVMAPNVAAKGNRRADAPSAPAPTEGPPPPAAIKAAMAELAKAQAKLLEKSEWVGVAFADRARAMHLGDEPAASIHGQASLKEARALVDEGVAVAPLPFPVTPPKMTN